MLRFARLAAWIVLAIASANLAHADANAELFAAIAAGNGQEIERLLDGGADVNGRNSEGVTALYVAAKMDRNEIAARLLAQGAEVDSRTRSGYTPLIQASHRGNRELVQLLISRGADVNARDNSGRSALLWSLGTALLDSNSPAGAAIKAQTLSQLGEQERQAALRDLESMPKQWLEVAKLLVPGTADVNYSVDRADTPLGLAAILGDEDLVAAILAKGANVDGGDAAHETPLHAAIAEKHARVAERLIRGGANVNARNRSGRTPLHFLAVYIGDANLADLLLERGADVNSKDKFGATPLTYALKFGNMAVAEALKSRGGI